ncbi:MAG: hypothetical protein AB1633_09010 [Elusimicrobiota bacterium]
MQKTKTYKFGDDFELEMPVPYCAICKKERDTHNIFDTSRTYFFGKMNEEGLPEKSMEICGTCYDGLSKEERDELHKEWEPM